MMYCLSLNLPQTIELDHINGPDKDSILEFKCVLRWLKIILFFNLPECKYYMRVSCLWILFRTIPM